jgi:putative oxidoreductase
MKRILGSYSDDLYALLRIVAGLLFACHGAQKLFGWLGGMGGSGASAELFTRIGLAGVIEFFGGVLIALGLGTGVAAFICSGEMAAAFFMMHAKSSIIPYINKGELAVVYCFVFFYIFLRGAGAPVLINQT